MDKMREEFNRVAVVRDDGRVMVSSTTLPVTWDEYVPARQSAGQERGEAAAYLCDGMRFKVGHFPQIGVAILNLPLALNGQWVALVDATDNKHMNAAPTDAQSRIAELEAKLALAYGLLWHVNAGMDAPHGTPSLTPERGAMESRKILRDLLTHEQRGDGINAARNYMAALAAEKE